MEGVLNGFELLPKDADIQSAEMHNYHSTTNPGAHASVEAVIRQEIADGNYVPVSFKPVIVSALGAVPKADSQELRLIHDCSMPCSQGVNSYINITKEKFQTVDDAVSLIGNNYFLAKVDLRHAYRSIPVHPANYPALGLKWKFKGDSSFSYLVDTRLPFGASSAPGIFHRITQAVKRMMARRGHSSLVVYLDDFLVVGESGEACRATYDELCSLLQKLGFQLSLSKLVPPTQKLVFLGIEFDTVTMSLALPSDKLTDLQHVIHSFCSRTQATKRQLQQLAGKLNWACKVVYGG